MYVLVTDGSAAVHEADDCNSLDVRIEASDRAGVADALNSAGLGSWDGGPDVDLIVQGLYALAHATTTAQDWEQRWAAMLGYAARNGWLAPDGSTVRAHVVGPSDAESA